MKTFMGIALLVLSAPVVAQPFFLSCDLVFQYDGSKMSVDYKIDEEKKTANDSPANFTETAISFNVKTSGGDLFTVVSRLSGRIRVTSGTDIVAQGTCAISTARKF